MKRDEVILVRGGGDLATGTIHRPVSYTHLTLPTTSRV